MSPNGPGNEASGTEMKRAITLTTLLVTGAVLAGSAAVAPGTERAHAAAGQTDVPQALPSYYIADIKRSKRCKDLITPPWLSFLSYASVQVSDEWRVYASSKSLCRIAQSTAYNMVSEAPHNDGAGHSIDNMTSYAEHFHVAKSTPGLKPAGKAYKCERLPSSWGQQAYDLARIAHRGIDDNAFAAASGPAAGAGFCETKAKRKGKQYTGGSFFTWAPDTTTCQRAYKLKEIPDPNNPGQTTNPPFPAAFFGDYDQVAC